MTGLRRGRHLRAVPDALPLDGLPDRGVPSQAPSTRTSTTASSPARGHRRREDDDVAPERRQPRVETCDHCLSEVRVFITAANHKRIPVDATPDPAGNLRRLSDGTMAVISKASQRAAMLEHGVQFWMPHVATCPKAALWAKKGSPSTNTRSRGRGGTLPADRPAPAATHRCPGGCGATVPNRLYACREDWARLPLVIRRRIIETNGPHVRYSERAAALVEAAEFFASERAR